MSGPRVSRLCAAALAAGIVLTLAVDVTYAASSPKSVKACANHKGDLGLLSKHGNCPKGYVKTTIGTTSAVSPGETFAPLFSSPGYDADTCVTGPTNDYQAEPVGCSSSTQTMLEQAAGAELISSSDFPSTATIRLDASLESNQTDSGLGLTSNRMCVRLFDVTASKVVGQPVCLTNTSDGGPIYGRVATKPVRLPRGSHYYIVEVAIPDAGCTDMGCDEDGGGGIADAVAVVQNK